WSSTYQTSWSQLLPTPCPVLAAYLARPPKPSYPLAHAEESGWIYPELKHLSIARGLLLIYAEAHTENPTNELLLFAMNPCILCPCLFLLIKLAVVLYQVFKNSKPAKKVLVHLPTHQHPVDEIRRRCLRAIPR